MRVVVIGATGNAGTSVLSALDARPEVEEIVGVARRLPRGPVRAPKARHVRADIRHADLVELVRGAAAVVHLAWMIQPAHDEAAMLSTNVEGTRRVAQAVVEAGVPALVYASSVGAYSPGPKTRRVDESWATDGIRSSFYSRHKAAVEHDLRRLAAEQPQLRVAMLRPGLIFQRGAASEIRRLFLGPLFPPQAASRRLLARLPVLPLPRGLAVQAVHADDVGEAYALAVLGDVRGAINVAADPVLDAHALGAALGARPVELPPAPVRAVTAATFTLRLQPTEPGWVDLALQTPLMATDRARALGWEPRRTSIEALHELLDGLRDRAGKPTAPLHPAGAH